MRMGTNLLVCAFAVAILNGQSITDSAKSPQESTQTKHVRVFLEGDTSDIPKFVKVAQEKGPERSLSFGLPATRTQTGMFGLCSVRKEAACGVTHTEVSW